jgi:steroid 5-alpha reductase family enzyme
MIKLLLASTCTIHWSDYSSSDVNSALNVIFLVYPFQYQIIFTFQKLLKFLVSFPLYFASLFL